MTKRVSARERGRKAEPGDGAQPAVPAVDLTTGAISLAHFLADLPPQPILEPSTGEKLRNDIVALWADRCYRVFAAITGPDLTIPVESASSFRRRRSRRSSACICKDKAFDEGFQLLTSAEVGKSLDRLAECLNRLQSPGQPLHAHRVESETKAIAAAIDDRLTDILKAQITKALAKSDKAGRRLGPGRPITWPDLGQSWIDGQRKGLTGTKIIADYCKTHSHVVKRNGKKPRVEQAKHAAKHLRKQGNSSKPK